MQPPQYMQVPQVLQLPTLQAPPGLQFASPSLGAVTAAEQSPVFSRKTIIGLGSLALGAGATGTFISSNTARVPAGCQVWATVIGSNIPATISTLKNGGDDLLNGGTSVPTVALDLSQFHAVGLTNVNPIEVGGTVQGSITNNDGANPVTVHLYAVGMSNQMFGLAQAAAQCATK